MMEEEGRASFMMARHGSRAMEALEATKMMETVKRHAVLPGAATGKPVDNGREGNAQIHLRHGYWRHQVCD